MPVTKPRRETIYAKAERMIAQGRYTMHPSSHLPEFWVGTCNGDHGIYTVFAVSEGFMADHGIGGGRVGCTCDAGVRRVLCSHAVGGEEMRLKGEGA